MGRLVANLEKRKPSPISPYLFYLYRRNECLKEEEIEELEVARKYLELGITPDAAGHLYVVEIDSKRESLNPREQQRILEGSPSSQKKSSYRSPEGKMPVQDGHKIDRQEEAPSYLQEPSHPQALNEDPRKGRKFLEET